MATHLKRLVNESINKALLIIILCSSCKPTNDDRLTIVNRSSQDWLYYYSTDNSLPEKCPFPYLFSTPEDYPEVSSHVDGYRGGREWLLTGWEKKALVAHDETWDNLIERSDDTLRIFVLSPKLIKQKGWDSIKAGKLWKYKYDLTINYLDKTNWIISIP